MVNDIIVVPHPENENIVELMLDNFIGIKKPNGLKRFSEILNRDVDCYDDIEFMTTDSYVKESDEKEQYLLSRLHYSLLGDLRFATPDEFEAGMKTLKENYPEAYVSFDKVKGVFIEFKKDSLKHLSKEEKIDKLTGVFYHNN